MPYTQSAAGIGLGTILSIGTLGASPTFTPVGELKTLTQSGRSVGTEDTTNFQSLAKEFIPTLVDSGTWDFSGNRIGGDSGQVAMEAAFSGLSLLPFKIQLPKTPKQASTGDTFTFNALVQDLNYSVSVDKAVTLTGKLKVSGIITETPGS